MKVLGDFHSHPDGTVPSAQDMRAHRNLDLHLWIIHHGRGEHTFEASRGIHHRKLELASSPLNEMRTPEFIGLDFHLGELVIDQYGRLTGDELSLRLLFLEEKQRKVFLAATRIKDRWNFVDNKKLAETLNITVPTCRRWMKQLEKLKFFHKEHGGWKVLKTM